MVAAYKRQRPLFLFTNKLRNFNKRLLSLCAESPNSIGYGPLTQKGSCLLMLIKGVLFKLTRRTKDKTRGSRAKQIVIVLELT